jgi:hypothetical protein
MQNLTRRIIITALLMALAIAFSLPYITGKAAAGEGEYAIVVSASASSTEIYAAETLQEYLNALNNSYYKIITDDRPFDGFKFCVGATSVYDTTEDI